MTVKQIDVKTAKQWLDAGEAILIDVREPVEHKTQKIMGAQLQPAGTICCSNIPETEKKILIHCQGGGRGHNVCQKLLAEDGTIEVYNIEGGIEAWQDAGFPIHNTDKKILPLNRQVHLTIGSAVLIFSLLAYFVHPAFALVSAFFGAGLANAGLTGWCGLAMLIAKMPWNR